MANDKVNNDDKKPPCTCPLKEKRGANYWCERHRGGCGMATLRRGSGDE